MTSTIKIYQVGGSVRDEILGIKSKDIDFVVKASSFEAMREYLMDYNYQIFLETPEYLTIRAKFPKDHPFLKQTRGSDIVDFTLCRTSSDTDKTNDMDHLIEDLSQRDFTVNAIAKDIDGSYIDPFNGEQDLKDGVLRCVGNARDRLTEDANRALRAIRFTITKGLVMNDELVTALKSEWLPPLLAEVSIERVRQELYKSFAADTIKTMKILHELSDEFRNSIFRDGLWLQPTNRKSNTRFRKHLDDE